MTEFEDLATQASEDDEVVKEAIDKSGEAKRKVEQARTKVDLAIDMVDDILSQLSEYDNFRLDRAVRELRHEKSTLYLAGAAG